MAHERNCDIGAVNLQECIEVREIVWKPVGLRRDPGLPETRPVGCDDEPVPIKFVNDELKGRAGVASAMQKHQQGTLRCSPFRDVIFDTSYLVPYRTTLDARLIHFFSRRV
jgi:hypothetical protein